MGAPARSSWWRWLGAGGRAASGDPARWVVVDTETTGLDPRRDALIAIGGVAVGPAGVAVEDSFEVVVRHDGPVDAGNVVIHGLGRDAQRAGMPPPLALQRFVQWVGDAPLVAYHAAFDRDVLEEAARRAGVEFPPHRWLDVAPVAAALAPAGAKGGDGGLDHWLVVHGIACRARHNAAADALATAELLVKLRRSGSGQDALSLDALAALARSRRWLAGA